MPWEMHEDFLELSVKQLVIKSSPISHQNQSQIWCEKKQILMLSVAKSARYFSYGTRVMQVQV